MTRYYGFNIDDIEVLRQQEGEDAPEWVTVDAHLFSTVMSEFMGRNWAGEGEIDSGRWRYMNYITLDEEE